MARTKRILAVIFAVLFAVCPAFLSASANGGSDETGYYPESLRILSHPVIGSLIRGATDLPDLSGLTLEVVWSDGRTDTWDGGFGGEVRGEPVICSVDGTEGNGGSARLILSLAGKETSLELPLTEDPVERIELLAAPEFRLIQGLDGYTDRVYVPDGYEDYFRYYYTYQPGGFRIRLLLKDGGFEDHILGDRAFGYPILLLDPQTEEHWTLGDGNRLYLRFLNHQTEAPVSVVEDPVAGFEAVAPSFAELIEGAEGWEEAYYDEDTGERKTYFRYNLDRLYDTLRFRILYKDGTSRTVGYGDSSDGGFVYDCTDQFAAPWTAGTENRAVFAFREYTAELPVHLLNNPVDRVEVTAQPSRTYIPQDPEYGFSFGETDYLCPGDLTGLNMTVYYKDGSSRQISADELKQEGYPGGYLLEGYPLTVEPIRDPAIGENDSVLTYMGAQTSVTLGVTENGVGEITLVTPPEKTAYYPGFFPDLRGASFEIRFRDGRKVTVAVTEESYAFFEGELVIPVDGETELRVCENGDPSGFVARCEDALCPLDCLREEQGKQILEVEPQSAGADESGTVFTLCYEDGSAEEVTVTPVKRSDPNGGAYTFVNGGVISVDVSQGEQSVWIMTVQDVTVTLEGIEVSSLLKGDVDGNDGVTSTDARLVLQLSVDKITEADLNHPQAADIDGDGVITSTDARLILQYSVNKITEWPDTF